MLSAEQCNYRLVKRDAQRLSSVQGICIVCVTAEIVKVLLHLSRLCHGLAQIAQRLPRGVELGFALYLSLS